MNSSICSEATVGGGEHLVGVENVVRVERLLDRRHGLNHGTALRVVQEGGLLLAYAVLRRHTPVNLATVVHHKRLDHILRPFLEASVFVSGQHNVEVEVTVADMPMAIGENKLLLFLGKLRRGLDEGARFVHYLVIVARRQADIVLERLYAV